MKVKTRDGEVELTADMVCRGMVFQSDNWDHPDAPGGVLTMATPDGGAAWKSTVGLGCVPLTAQRCLGCDPAIATRPDCERFGVHGDAAAHGFANVPNGGALDLTRPENVKKGMLFRFDGREAVAACDGHFSIAKGQRVELLGCHPALAQREDCERFGIPIRCEQHGEVSPLDAAAHGFARLRDGGAVDLRVAGDGLPRGSVVQREGETGPRVVMSENKPALWQIERFIGLDDRTASPEDVRRLCCGAKPAYEDLAPVDCCTLAIGDHDQHEDLATGTRWPAQKGGYWHLHLPSRPRVRIGALTFPCDIGLDSRDRYRVRFEAKIGDLDRELAGAAARSLAAGEPCVLEMGDQKIPCLAAQWSHEADPMRRNVERFELTLWRQHQEAPAEAAVLSDFAADVLGVPREAQTVTTYEPKDGGRVTHVRAAPATGSNSTATLLSFGGVPAPAPTPLGKNGAVDMRDAPPEWRAAQAFGLFLAGLQAWAASPAGLLAARDAAVAKAIADVPEGCDPKRWANVVRVLAADNWCGVGPRDTRRAERDFVMHFQDDVGAAMFAVGEYAQRRFVFRHSAAEATRLVADACAGTDYGRQVIARLCAAYEAG